MDMGNRAITKEKEGKTYCNSPRDSQDDQKLYAEQF